MTPRSRAAVTLMLMTVAPAAILVGLIITAPHLTTDAGKLVGWIAAIVSAALSTGCLFDRRRGSVQHS